eukprot:TRINITY_DN409_c0_g1_i6.p1 TRINITY_DN409_c0_g1~~TRINITY_DN409_c0_g1_i6.p1  ORF type:complete len:383 (+),score=110.99 TRINITY_DN409_c0_g1_i6:299-1447(+)
MVNERGTDCQYAPRECRHFDVNDFRFAINHAVHFQRAYYSYIPNHLHWIPRIFRSFFPSFPVEIGSVVTEKFKAQWFYLTPFKPEDPVVVKKKYDGFIRVSCQNMPTKKFDFVVLYVHGGAFLLGSPLLYLNIFGKVMKCGEENGVNIGFLGVEYTLAPEKAFPTQIREVEGAFELLLEEGYSSDQILFAGDSAGGNISLASVVLCRKLQREVPRAVIALSPWLDLTCNRMSASPNNAFDWIGGTKEEYAKLVYMYTQGHEVTDPLVSPIYADLKGFPDVLLLYGGREILYDDCVHFVQRAKEAGVKVRVAIDEHATHVFPLLNTLTGERTAEIENAVKEIVNFILSLTKHKQTVLISDTPESKIEVYLLEEAHILRGEFHI